MADEADSKATLIAELDQARAEFSGSFAAFRQDIDVPAHLRRSFRRHKLLWIAGALIVGFVLAKLPARKKKVKVYIDKEDKERKVKGGDKVKEAAEAGFLFVLLKFALSVLRPAATAFATKQVTDWLENRGK
jgi:hypothetical protein